MGLGGEDLKPMFPSPADGGLWSLAWSPDSRWLTYLRRRPGQTEGAVLEAHVPGTGNATTVFEDPALRGFCWLAPNHIVLDRWEAPERPFSNLWEIDVDPKTMKAHGKPRRLTNWAGFAIGSMSASTDGKRLTISVAVGDEVLYGRYAGNEVDVNGKDVKIMRESDLLAKVVK